MDSQLISSFAGDQDMVELIDMFVQELPDRVDSIEAALAAGDLATLQVVAHQLKGSGGSYGFQVITEAAAVLERDLKRKAAPATIHAGVTALVQLLQRATRSLRPATPS